MSLVRLSYFVAVAEELSFTRASARLHVSQPPLTQQIQRLEQEVGEKLIERSTRRISLTPAGRALLPEARRILENYRRLPALAHEAARSAAVYTIGSVPSAVIGVIPELLRRYRGERPDVSLRVHELNIEDQLPMLRVGDLDVGIFRSHSSDEEWSVVDLPVDSFVVVLPADHPLAAQEEVLWIDLAHERFVLSDRAKATIEFDSIVAACINSGFSPHIVAETVGGYNLVALVASGLGIGIVPQCVTALRQAGVVYRPLAPTVNAVPLRLAVRPDRLDENLQLLGEIARTVSFDY